MKLIEITKPENWEAIQSKLAWPQFTQSWAWGQFRLSLGFKVRRFALLDEEKKCLAAAQMEFRPKKFVGGYWFAPRGPAFLPGVPENFFCLALQELVDQLAQAQLERSLFWRFEPVVELGHPEGAMPLDFRRYAPVNPASTILLDLTRSTDDILSAMHQKTRYNIRVAARKGVITRIATHPEDVKIFLDLMDETARRDKFTQHDRAYLKSLYDFFQADSLARIRLAEYQGKVLAANLELVCRNTATYLHGASSSESRNLMAPFVAHWDAISQAKRDSLHTYDFWGVNPISKAAFTHKPSWEGITRFKEGWGGKRVDLYGTWDLPFNLPLYRTAFWRQWRA